MSRSRGPVLALAAAVLWTAPGALAQTIRVRVTPPEKAQFLQHQLFDIRVEATAQSSTDVVTALSVAIDGVDVTARGNVEPGASSNVRSWVFRDAGLGFEGPRVITATATGTSAGSPISGEGRSTLFVRPWDQSRRKGVSSRALLDSGPEFALAGARASVRVRGEEASDEEPGADELHLGAIVPAFHKVVGEDLAGTRPRAKNVILLIGDGMGVAHRTAARVLSRGYVQGKANAPLSMDTLPFNGLLMTSSLDSLITDSAPGAHNYSTGNKTNNGMEGVFPDNTPAEDDNPRLEHLSSFIGRQLGKVTGIVSDAFLTDATPAAFLAHTQNRGNGTLIAGQYFDLRSASQLKVLLGGGGYHFIPKSQTGSRRTDERNVVGEFRADGWSFVETKTALDAYSPSGSDPRLLGLFHLDNMSVAFDKLGFGDPAVNGPFLDQPFLRDMTEKAIEVLSTYPNGFFLMVEAAHIDKQAHRMDAERSIYDVIQLDHAVQVALDFAMQTNSDADPENDTLVIVSADHECAGVTLPGVGRPEKKGTRDYVKTYNYRSGRNDPDTLNFTDYVDANHDGYPDNPDTGRKLIVNFGANSDRYEDWASAAKPKDPGVTQNGVALANPNDPDKDAPGGYLIVGVVENGVSGGDANTQAVHTLSDIPISAYGPGASQFARVTDNTEAFFHIVHAMLGTYPVPTQY
ncbi:MAG: alkaline phosphatase [Thermoanaerobaculia bacterium]|jgi:alkaline phosphatase|nr:alkaline phosphatase [Thermoanaerobaculia bacterium]